MVEKGISEDQCAEIKDMMEEDFDEDNGIGVSNAYDDCARYGTEAEAYDSIVDAITDRIPTEIDPKTGKMMGLYDGKIPAAIRVEDVAWAISTMWSDQGFFEFMEDMDNTIPNFLKALNWQGQGYGDFEHIDVNEPRYGWDGFDDKLWKELTAGFARRVVKILTGRDSVEPGKTA